MLRSTPFCWFLALICIAAADYACAPKTIPEAAEQCCGAGADCCAQRMLRNETVTPCFGRHSWRAYAVCLEKAFYCVSVIEENADKCCWLLYSRECREGCMRNFRKPTLSIDDKVNFVRHCPFDNDPIPVRESHDECDSEECQRNRLQLHNCFPTCLRTVKLVPDAFDDADSAAKICRVDLDDTNI